MQLEANPPIPQYRRWKYETLKGSTKERPKPSIEEPPTFELKPLPFHLKYAFLNKNDKLPIIISSSLTDLQENKLLRILRAYKKALGWTIADIKRISPSICTHKILMEKTHKPKVQP